MNAPVDVLHAIDRQLAYIDASDYEGARDEYRELLAARKTMAELLDVVKRFWSMYGHLWDLVEPEGAGFLSPESVAKYDEIHGRARAVLAKVKGGAK